jgi:hypothetical protein
MASKVMKIINCAKYFFTGEKKNKHEQRVTVIFNLLTAYMHRS